jgi:hypothetical protein
MSGSQGVRYTCILVGQAGKWSSMSAGSVCINIGRQPGNKDHHAGRQAEKCMEVRTRILSKISAVRVVYCM